MTVRLEELLAAATPGPWNADANYVVGQVPSGRPGGEVIGTMRASVPMLDTPMRADAELAALAPDAVRLLIDMGEELRTLYNSPGEINYMPGIPPLLARLDRLGNP